MRMALGLRGQRAALATKMNVTVATAVVVTTRVVDGVAAEDHRKKSMMEVQRFDIFRGATTGYLLLA